MSEPDKVHAQVPRDWADMTGAEKDAWGLAFVQAVLARRSVTAPPREPLPDAD